MMLAIQFTDTAATRLENMRADFQCDYQELLNLAISFLEWGLAQRGRGRIVASVDEANKVYSEIELPAICARLKKPVAGTAA